MTDKKHTEPFYKAEACQAPLGETGDYDSWIELVTPNFNLQCFDPNIELEEVQELADMLNALAGIDNPAEWVEAARSISEDYAKRVADSIILKEENDKLQAENERLKKEIAEWELFSKAANESIEERNETIAQLRKTSLKALETIKVSAEAEEEVSGYDLKDLIELCNKFKKAIKGE